MPRIKMIKLPKEIKVRNDDLLYKPSLRLPYNFKEMSLSARAKATIQTSS